MILNRNIQDRIFTGAAALCAGIVILIVAGIFVELLYGSRESLANFGFGFLFSQDWDPVTGQFGALSSIYGTLLSTGIALFIAVPLSLIIALFLVELAPPAVSGLVGGAIELLAAIPSIIYGMWGLFVLAPIMVLHVQPFIARWAGDIPLFTGPPMGIGMMTAGIVLAIMILPFVTSVTRDIFRMVPPVVKESAYGLGATTWEVTGRVTVRHGIMGIVGAVFLGLGRAIGETMAVTFVIGNTHRISPSLFAAGNSIASTLANEFTEAAEDLYLSSLIELGLVLFGITFLIQLMAHLWLARIRRKMGMPR